MPERCDGRMAAPALAAHQSRALSTCLVLERGRSPALRSAGFFFGPRAWFHSGAVCRGIFSLSQYRAAQSGDCELLSSAPVRATRIPSIWFCIHCFGRCIPSPTIIGAISDRSNLRIGLGSTLFFCDLMRILPTGASFAPPARRNLPDSDSLSGAPEPAGCPILFAAFCGKGGKPRTVVVPYFTGRSP